MGYRNRIKKLVAVGNRFYRADYWEQQDEDSVIRGGQL